MALSCHGLSEDLRSSCTRQPEGRQKALIQVVFFRPALFGARPPSIKESGALFSDNFRRGESEKSRFSGVKRSKLVSSLSGVAWKAFRSVNRPRPEGEAIRPKWAPGPLLKSYERTAPPLGFPRET